MIVGLRFLQELILQPFDESLKQDAVQCLLA